MKRLFIVFTCLFLFIVYGSTLYSNESEIRLLYINDFHGFAQTYKPYGSDEYAGGIAYLAWLAGQLRKEKPTLFLAAGDMIQGNNWANLFQGKSVIELMNEMKFDAMVVGNHEFDFGQKALRERIEEAKFPVLGANVETDRQSPVKVELPTLQPYVLKELNNIKIAIIGITTEEMPIVTHPKNVTGLKFLSQVGTAEKYVKELRNKVDLIVVLSHIGYHQDMVLAERVKDIDIIVGGHSHTKVERPALVGKTVILQAWEHAKVLGVLDVTVTDGKMTGVKNKLVDIKPTQLNKDDTVASIVDKYSNKVGALLQEVIGETEVDLDRKNVRSAETNFGNFVADIIRQTSGAQTAIINGGSIRTSIKKGVITADDIYTALPFDNYIIAFTLTGKQIRETLEYAISSIKEGGGRFPQLSGITFSYVDSEDNPPKIKDIFIAGMPLEPDKHYTVGTNDFLAAGGDGYKLFREAINTSKDYSVTGGAIIGKGIIYNDPGRWLRDIVIDYIKSRKKISPVTEGRIVEIR
ncbi:MAG: 5'-nucleotidase C-terminal domain-containing protein [Proteobacteria bacterium]|nr:5'-nucleotidase C-terminal domain-containing protein [Pseudomonadota bacterium]